MTDFTYEFVFKMRLLGLSDVAVRRQFGCSQPTLQRWKEGANAPHPAMRACVLAWLDLLLEHPELLAK